MTMTDEQRTDHLPNGVGWWKDGRLCNFQPPGISYEVCLTMDADRAIRKAVAAAEAAERERIIAKIEAYRVPVGNSAAGELAAEWTMAALRELRDEVREPCAAPPATDA